MNINSQLPDSQKLEKHWQEGKLPCPECGHALPLGSLSLMKFNECPKCHANFFAPQKIKDYYLFEPAGGGGMGSVYKAVSPKYKGRLLAVKILSRDERSNPSNILAILNEARISSRFKDSEYLAACLDSGYDNDEYFTVMPFVSGERLDKRITRLNRLPEQEVIVIALHVLAAEQHIYNCGYLFRDLKPENIIINGQGYAILIDFGLCMTREHALHPDEEYVSGSPYYIPPERLTGSGENASSEIYSLGMVMYQALMGKTFFDAAEIDSLAKRHLSKIRLSVESKLDGINPALAKILAKMLAQKQEDRPQSFQEVFGMLQPLLNTK
ncbi:MAG: serine/threonine protein kinase [Lentisphaeria bacterium]|nr:serine/threonine protein kinase [Lentisphaeria bacterium]